MTADETVDMTLEPVGVVESTVLDRRLMPPHGVPSTIVIDPKYQDAMFRLDENSHIWVIGWYVGAERGRHQILRPEYPQNFRRRGVFGLRSTTRPNSIATSVGKIIKIDENRIELDRLGFLNGTPVLDIKRYSSTWDSVHSARSSRAMFAEVTTLTTTEELEHSGALFHGELAPEIVRAARLVQFVCRAWEIRPKDDRLTFALPVGSIDGAFVDGIQGMTGATFGNGRLRVASDDRIVASAGERVLQCRLKPIEGLDLTYLRIEPIESLYEIDAG